MSRQHLTLLLSVPMIATATFAGPPIPENRCGLSSITAGERDVTGRGLTDGDTQTEITINADESAIVVRFHGAARWLNTVVVHGISRDFTVETLNLSGEWAEFGEGAAAPGTSSSVSARDTLAQALRVSPSGEGGITLAEVEAYFHQDDPDGGDAEGSGDGKEYFYEWIENYATSPLYNCEPDAEKLANGLPNDWTTWGYGNSNAWEEDWKRADLGGTNNTYVDSADLVYFSGHGTLVFDSYYATSLRSMMFSDTTHDDQFSVPGDCWGAWDSDMEWAAFSGCNVLEYPSRAYWHDAMRGAHGLFGWADVIPDIKYGKKWAKGMNGTSIFDPAKTMKQAWFDMAESKLGSGYQAVVVGETSSQGGDYLWGEGTVTSDPTYDGTYTVWTYTTTSSTAPGSPKPDLDGTWPAQPRVFEPGEGGVRVIVDQSVLDGDAVEGGGGLPTFFVDPITGEVIDIVIDLRDILCQFFPQLCGPDLPMPTDEDTINVVNGPYQLRWSELTGGFEFLRADQWWRDYTDAPNVPSNGAAIQTAQEMLGAMGLLPQTAELLGVRTAMQIEETVQGVESNFPVHKQVIFRRTLAGLPVFGAGGQMSVCVGPQGVERINRNAWRQLVPGPMVQPIPLAAALQGLANHGANAAIGGLSGQFVDIIVHDTQLGYFEYDDETDQSALRPTWMIIATGVEANGATSAVRIAIEADTFPISVDVIAPENAQSGAELCFDALVNGGVAPFEYRWSSDIDGDLGTGPQLCYTPSNTGDENKPAAETHVLTVEVTDAVGHIRRGRVSFTACTLPDVNGDGLVDLQDLLELLGHWNETVEPGTNGDVSGDGLVDLVDLLEVLAHWGDSC